MVTCVYCNQRTPDVAFNREHVLPEAFGRFKGALTLHDAVCKPCNTYFSKTLDLELGRKSIEGLERYRWGAKQPEEIKRFQFDHIHLRAADDGDFKGAPVQLYHNAEMGRLVAKPRTGVAIHNADGEGFTHFSLEEIENGAWKERAVDWRRGIKIYGSNQAVDRIRSILFEQGVRPTKFRPLEPPVSDIKVEQEFVITDLMRRAIAKIAFNYLTFRQGAEFALLKAFDPIRSFIRYGSEPPSAAIHSTMDLPFRSALPPDQRPVLHWIEIAAHPSHRNLLATVMLFGFMNHAVMLAEDFPGPWPELPLAHAFFTKSLIVREMTPVTPRWRHTEIERPLGSGESPG